MKQKRQQSKIFEVNKKNIQTKLNLDLVIIDYK